MQGSGGLILSMPTLIVHRTASQTERKPGPALGRNQLIPPPTSHVAFCASPICPLTRSIGLAGMKQPFGARPARSCLLLIRWIAANQGTEGPVIGLAAGINCRPTSAMNADFRARPSPHCSTRPAV